jgi:hypothetical protein
MLETGMIGTGMIEFGLAEGGRNGIVRQAKQQGTLFLRELLSGAFLAGSRAGCGFAAFRPVYF